MSKQNAGSVMRRDFMLRSFLNLLSLLFCRNDKRVILRETSVPTAQLSRRASIVRDLDDLKLRLHHEDTRKYGMPTYETVPNGEMILDAIKRVINARRVTIRLVVVFTDPQGRVQDYEVLERLVMGGDEASDFVAQTMERVSLGKDVRFLLLTRTSGYFHFSVSGGIMEIYIP